MSGYIDLHCHVLPGLDDGPDAMSASVEMVHALAREGITTVVATPHLRSDFPDVSPRAVSERCADLQARAREAGANVRILTGAEVSLEWAGRVSRALLAAATLGGNGRDLLIETPYGPLGSNFEQRVGSIMGDGFRVTIAHPEMSEDLQRDRTPLLRLVEQGALVQVSARSLLRSRRKSRSAALARDLVRDGHAHVVATDAHSAGPWRAPDLARGVLEATSLAGPRGEWMVTAAPAAILAGEPLPPVASPATRPVRRRRFALAR